jgi:hypothetical protein
MVAEIAERIGGGRPLGLAATNRDDLRVHCRAKPAA